MLLIHSVRGAHTRSWTGDLFITNEVLYRLSYASETPVISALPSYSGSLTYDQYHPIWIKQIGAGSGDRTRVSSLEGWGSTAELYPPTKIYSPNYNELVEGGGFEPPKLARQIYSLIPLATREPLPQDLPRVKFPGSLTQERHFMGIG